MKVTGYLIIKDKDGSCSEPRPIEEMSKDERKELAVKLQIQAAGDKYRLVEERIAQ